MVPRPIAHSRVLLLFVLGLWPCASQADSSSADSGDLSLNLLSLPSATTGGFADSPNLAVDVRDVNRTLADSADFSMTEPNPTPTLSDVAVSSSIVELGQSFEVHATLTDTGGIGDHGGMAISFPELTATSGTLPPYDTAQASVVDAGSVFSSLRFSDAGDMIDVGGTPGPAQHLLVEGDKPSWNYPQSQTLRLAVTPRQCGVITIRVRAWIARGGTSGDGPPVYRDPAATGAGIELDQQQYAAQVLTVTVVPSAPHQSRSVEAVGAWNLHTAGIRGNGVKIGVVDYAAPVLPAGDPVLGSRYLPAREGNTGAADSSQALMVAVLAAGSACNPAYDPQSPDYVPYTGMAPAATVLPVAVDASVAPDEWVDEFEQVFQAGADVITCSVAGTPGFKGASDLERFIDRIVDEGSVPVCVAVGRIHDSNGNVQHTSPACPSNAYNCIAVSALTDTAGNYSQPTGSTSYSRLANESVIGPTSGGRSKPELCAPADAVWPNPLSLAWNAGDTGTSGATPHVAGAIALLIDAARVEESAGRHLPVYSGSTVYPYALKAILLTSAAKSCKALTYDDQWNPTGTRSWQTSSGQPLDHSLGAGRLDVLEAYKTLLNQDQTDKTRRSTAASVTWGTGPVSTVPLGQLDRPRRLVATLAWNAHFDPVASDSALNNLDLVLLREGVEVAKSNSAADNVEHLWTTLQPGNHSLEIRFTGHDSGITATEPFALAYILSDFAQFDFNADGNIDQNDLDAFVACGTGPTIAYDSAQLPQPSPGCTLVPDAQGLIAADFDQDRDVDADDFGWFQRCWSGDLPADPNCLK